MGVFQLRTRLSSRRRGLPLRELLDGGRELDLAGALLLFDASLAALEQGHATGRAHGAVSIDSILVGADGAVTLAPPATPAADVEQPLVFANTERPEAAIAADVREATEVFVAVLAPGVGGAGLPLAARELVRRGLGADGSPPAAAEALRVDTAAVGHAFIGDGWRGLGAAALAAAVGAGEAAEASSGQPRRRWLRLTGAAMGVLTVVAAVVMVSNAMAANPPDPGARGVSSVIAGGAGSPDGAAPLPANATPASSPTVPPANRPRTAAATTAGTPPPGATAELNPPPAPSTAASAGEPTPTAAVTPAASPTPAVTPTPTASAAPKPTATPTAKPTATPTAKPTATPTAKPTATPTAKPKPTPTAKPTATPTAKPTPTPKPSPAPTSKSTP